MLTDWCAPALRAGLVTDRQDRPIVDFRDTELDNM